MTQTLAEFKRKRRDYSKKYYDRDIAQKAKNRNKHWTKDELDLLMNNTKYNDTELSHKLGRTLRSIQEKRHRLRAQGHKIHSIYDYYSHFSKDDVKLIMSDMPAREIAKKLNVSLSAVHNARYKRRLK